ncbi:MAG: PIG-L deacetylase family protein, partial [Bacteroidota bacterium]
MISLYMTNGEATPSDFNGETPFRLAARRKEEAYRSMTYIGGETLFLNVSDAGIVNDRGKLEHFWNPDTVIAGLTEVIRTYRPDVVLINRDLRGEPGVTLRQSTLQDFLLNAIRAVQDSLQAGTTKVGSDMLSWKVQRIFVDKGTQKQPFQMNIDLRHPIWKKSYREIAEEAVENYESLRAQIPAWRKQGDRSYTLLSPSRSEAPSSFDSGLELVSPRLQGIANDVAQLANLARTGGSANALGLLSTAIDSVVRALGWGTFKLTKPERRALITWKGRLEDLRCSLLDVDIQFEVSDSLVTRRQLFFLNFTNFKAKVGAGKTEILFPGVLTGNWVVDESLEHRFPFQVPREFRILTPKKLEFNTPLAVFGLDRAMVRTNLSFIILHQDSLPERNFQYRKDIPLRVGPRFSSEILTPVLYVTPGERLVYRFQNLTRDGVYGETFVEDSLVSSDHKRFHLRTKDSSVLD